MVNAVVILVPIILVIIGTFCGSLYLLSNVNPQPLPPPPLSATKFPHVSGEKESGEPVTASNLDPVKIDDADTESNVQESRSVGGDESRRLLNRSKLYNILITVYPTSKKSWRDSGTTEAYTPDVRRRAYSRANDTLTIQILDKRKNSKIDIELGRDLLLRKLRTRSGELLKPARLLPDTVLQILPNDSIKIDDREINEFAADNYENE